MTEDRVVIQNEKLHRQLEALASTTGIWKDEDHPELAQGSEAYVRRLRSLGASRMERIETNRDRH